MAGTIRYGVLITLRDQISQGLGKVRKRLQGLGQATERTSRYARRGLMGLAGALGTVLYFAGQQEQADVELAAALDKIGAAATDALPDLKAFASGVQDVTRYGDEAVEGAMTQMVNIAALQGEQLKKATKAAIGLAAAYKMDLATAAMLVARAAKGQTQTLTRYGIVLDMTASKEEQFAQLLKIGADQFTLAEEATKSLTGRKVQLTNRLGDLLEIMGETIFGTKNLGETFHVLEGRLKAAGEWMKDLTQAQKDQIRTWLKLTAGVLLFVGVLSPLLKGLAALAGLLGVLSGPAGIIAGLFAVIAGALITVADAVGLTNTGLYRMEQRLAPLDEMWTSLGEAMLKVGDIAGGVWARLKAGTAAGRLHEMQFGATPEAARPLGIGPGTQRTIEQMWADFYRRHPKRAEAELGVNMAPVSATTSQDVRRAAQGANQAAERLMQQSRQADRATADQLEKLTQTMETMKDDQETLAARLKRLSTAR